MARLDNSFDNVVSEGTEVLMLGDFNCDFLSKRESIPECKQLKALCKSLHIKQLIKAWCPYNRWDRYDTSKKLRDQNDCMETVRSAIIAIAEIEHFLSQRS